MIINGDCIEEMQKLIDQGVQVDAVVTDPPYHLQSIVDRFGKTSLSDDTKTSERARGRSDGYARMSAGGFMGQEWDGGDIAFRAETWRLAWELLKPGGHLLAFSASRNYHRMAVAIEDAGFEIRDQMMWLYGSGFPKSLNISKAIDKAAGAEREVVGSKVTGRAGTRADKRNADDGFESGNMVIPVTAPATPEAKQWDGWGTALKPAHEPIAVGRKPISESTVAKNVLKHGTGGINIDESRIPASHEDIEAQRKTSGVVGGKKQSIVYGKNFAEKKQLAGNDLGRFPANIMHDGSEEVAKLFPDTRQAGNKKPSSITSGKMFLGIGDIGKRNPEIVGDNGGSASRFFYCPKVSKKERGENNKHPTVKPQELMKYLVRLVTPKGGTVLDPFMGSGSTGMAAKDLGFDFIGIEKSEEYFKICQERIDETNPLSEFFD
jgi:DNA modification methylase